jgi:hypothetical protein
MTMLATLVDIDALLKTVAASAVAGVGVTLVFSIAVYGATRFADMSRDDRPLAAGAAAVVAILGVVAFLSAVTVGIIVMTQK